MAEFAKVFPVFGLTVQVTLEMLIKL